MRNTEQKLEALKGALNRHTSRLRAMTRQGMPDASEVDRETELFEKDVSKALVDFSPSFLTLAPTVHA